MEQVEAEITPHWRVTNALFLISGLWLAASPYLLGFAWHTAAWWNAIVIGICMVVLAMIRLSNLEQFRGLRWTALILGGWMIASPFVAGYAELAGAMWNAIIVGAVIAISAVWAARAPIRRPA